MKKAILPLLALGVIAFTGCGKDDNNNVTPNNSAPLTGNWKLNSYAIDSNRDNVMQITEQRALESGEYGYLYATNQHITDSFGIGGARITLEYTYLLRNDSVFSSMMGETELQFVIQKLDATTLNILRPYSTGTEWYFYTRQ